MTLPLNLMLSNSPKYYLIQEEPLTNMAESKEKKNPQNKQFQAITLENKRVAKTSVSRFISM